MSRYLELMWRRRSSRSPALRPRRGTTREATITTANTQRNTNTICSAALTSLQMSANSLVAASAPDAPATRSLPAKTILLALFALLGLD